MHCLEVSSLEEQEIYSLKLCDTCYEYRQGRLVHGGTKNGCVAKTDGSLLKV